MATTKKQLAEQAMRVLAGGHLKPDRNLDIREVMLYIDQLRDNAVRVRTFENIQNGQYRVDEDFLSFYESVAIQTDTTKSLKYITLPADPISLPENLGLYQISPIGDMEDAYIIITAGQAGIYYDTQALEHELKVFCWHVGDKVYFKNIDEALSEITVLMAASSKDIGELDDYPVPPDMEGVFVQQAIEAFSIMKQIPHDELEDGQK